jgi:uncharacterized damage-inducible protein DinB
MTSTQRPDWRRRPTPDEHAPYFAKYVALVPDADLLETLKHEGAATLARLRALPPAREDHRYAPGKWSVRELVGHVIDAERVFCYRALAFARGDANPLPGFEEDDWARTSNAGARSLGELCDDWEAVRAATIRLFGGMDAAALDRRGTANEVPVTVRALAWLLAGHAVHHRAILEERYLR